MEDYIIIMMMMMMMMMMMTTMMVIMVGLITFNYHSYLPLLDKGIEERIMSLKC